MDNLTHTLFAATLAATPMRAAGRGATFTILLASNVPDIDIVTAFTGGAQEYLAAHRGFTHGPVGVAALAIATAAAVRAACRGARFGPLLGVSLLGVLLHVALDLPTSYGTRLLSPFTETWYALDWLPIIDVYLWIVLAVGTYLAWRRGARPRAAAMTIGAMIAVYGIRAIAHDRALQRTSASDVCVIRGVAAWQPGAKGAMPECSTSIAALPRFHSPFEWRLIEHRGTEYRVSEVNVLSGTTTTPVRIASAQGPLVTRAESATVVRRFLDFSRHPVARTQSRNGASAVTWHDLRFVSPAGPLKPDARPRGSLFSVSVVIDADGRIIDERFGE